MKRALAERAKQSGLRNGIGGHTGSTSSSTGGGGTNGPTTTTSSSELNVPTDAPPLKIPRISSSSSETASTTNPMAVPEKTGTLISLPEESLLLSSSKNKNTSSNDPSVSTTTTSGSLIVVPTATTTATPLSGSSSSGATPTTGNATPRGTAAAAANTVAATTSGSSGRNPSSMKRQRTSNSHSEKTTEETENFSAFYLKHQNRALASELKALQYQLLLLEKERDFRRKQCRSAVETLQSLDATWTQMETALQLGEAPAASIPQMRAGFRSTDPDEPRSTGVGNSVELVGALLDSLAALGSPQKLKDDALLADNSPPPPDDLDATELEHLTDLQRISFGISRRAILLQQWIWTLLQKLESPASTATSTALSLDTATRAAASSSSTVATSPPPPSPKAIFDQATLYKEISELQSQCRDYEAQIDELTKARDDLTDSERKVRRGLYRLAAGRMKLDEVLKAIEDSDEDGAETAAWMVGPLESLTTATAAAATLAATTIGGPEEEKVDSAHLAQLKKQLADLEEIASCREKKIQEMLAEREEHLKRINELCLPTKSEEKVEKAISDEEVKQSTLFIATASKLSINERLVVELRARIDEIKQKWAMARGDADLALKSLRELEESSSRRMIELAGAETTELHARETTTVGLAVESNSGGDGAATTLSSSSAWSESVSQAQQIVQLEHKLTQALENVRQAEYVRQSLTEALLMNESLQLKLDELKAKYTALLSTRNSAGRASVETLPSAATAATTPSSSASAPTSSSNSTPREKAPAAPAAESATTASQAQPNEKIERNEKLHREYRRLRKELEATRASKESAKAKLERAEKEREQLTQTNVRLLKQSTEKDDMNAKSLSTILHLKHLTEQLAKEKENLEVQAKTAGQLALSARLTANAKERVSEEVSKEKEALESTLGELRERCGLLDQEKEALNGTVSQLRHEMHSLASDFAKAKHRCDELAVESTRQETEKQKYSEALAVAQRQAAEAVKNLASLSRQAGGGSGFDGSGGAAPTEFTAEQLSTQVAVLKGRLACPVCNHRDKKCILMRCRHMFCKHCVEENLKNRSRKCPACGQAFGAKDVHDVWL